VNVSKEQLIQIIKEELSQAVQEGEIDEGFLDKLLGKGDSPEDLTDFVSDEKVKAQVDKAESAVRQLYLMAGKQGNPNLRDLAKDTLIKVQQMPSMISPKGPAMMAKAGKGFGANVFSIENMYNDLKDNKKIDSKRIAKYILLMQTGEEPGKQQIEKLSSKSYEDLKNQFLKIYPESIGVLKSFQTGTKTQSAARQGRAATRISPISGFGKFEQE
jgi:hypothetical protein